MFSQIQLNIDFFIEEIEEEGNIAFATTISKGTVKIHANGAEAPEANRELFVFEKVEGNWKIARYMFNKTATKAIKNLQHWANSSLDIILVAVLFYKA